MERVIGVMPEVDPTLAGAAKTTLGRMEHDLKGLRSKMIQAAKKRDETLRRQFSRAQSSDLSARDIRRSERWEWCSSSTATVRRWSTVCWRSSRWSSGNIGSSQFDSPKGLAYGCPSALKGWPTPVLQP